ncbi:hypothetical protein OGAPHI_003473 [Ogataea philodendri]|uniref:Uncharacterized protein n=1 Tax=Ogataea philodendri TaxID=1378263 RepID=A0A9P8P7X3_9ASCO|nr:uncharacterized protein OGAPHI_003473 [Ogataea philodendri]KAH3666477.1 hypothetical protein OGAPHI_003473 [Ogataea philodendri]
MVLDSFLNDENTCSSSFLSLKSPYFVCINFTNALNTRPSDPDSASIFLASPPSLIPRLECVFLISSAEILPS